MKTLLISAVLLLLPACAAPKGVEITEDERKACEAETCTVWTQRELHELARQAMQAAYKAGHEACTKADWKTSAKHTEAI